jgi:hypothetical protein
MNISARPTFLKEATRYARGPVEAVQQNIDSISSTSGGIEETLSADLQQKLIGRPASEENASQLTAFEHEVFEAVQDRHPNRVDDSQNLTVQFVSTTDDVIALGLNLPKGGGVTAYIDPLPGEDGGHVYVSDASANRLRWPHVVRQAGDFEYLISK